MASGLTSAAGPTAPFRTSLGKFASCKEGKEGSVPASRRRVQQREQGAVPSLYTTRSYGGGQGHVSGDTCVFNIEAKNSPNPAVAASSPPTASFLSAFFVKEGEKKKAKSSFSLPLSLFLLEPASGAEHTLAVRLLANTWQHPGRTLSRCCK